MVSFASRPGSIYPKTVSATSLIPDELIRLDQWVSWRYGKLRSSGKRAKDPVDQRTGHPGDITNPEMWRGHGQALAYSREHNLAGIGFVISEDDPFFGVDWDDCGDRSKNYIHPAVLEDLHQLGIRYAEWSPSGHGIKGWGKGEKPGDRCKKTKGNPWGGDFEMYDHDRFFTITGDTLPGFDGPVVEAQDALEDLYERYFPTPSQAVEVAAHGPLPEPVDLTDGELLEKARTAEYGREFVALFDHGNITAHGNDASKADFALMRQLRFWTQADRDRMMRLFSESALGQRAKSKERKDYTGRTADAALKRGGKVYEPEQHRPQETRVRDELTKLALYAHLLHPWGEITGSARSASTDYFGFLSMLRRAWTANTLEIFFSERDYKDENGLGNNETAATSRTRQHDLHRLVERVRDDNHGNAARYRIKKVALPDHIQIGDVAIQLNPPCVDKTYGPLMTPEGFGPWLIRHPSPATDKTHDSNGRPIPQATGDSLRSLGKPAAMALNIAHIVAQLTGRPAPVWFLASRLGTAPKDFKRRQGRDLVRVALLEESEDGKGYRVPEDVGATLERELRDSGALRKHAEGLDRTATARRHQRIRKLWWLGMNQEQIAVVTGFDPDEIAAVVTPPDEAPTTEEMDARNLAKSAHGEYADLEREAEHFPEVFTPDADPQHPIGHDYPEVTETPVSAPEPVQRAVAPTDRGEAPEDDTDAVEDEAEVLNLKTGPEIVAGFGEAKDHALSCDCDLCCVQTPSYVPLVPPENVIDLEEYRRERVA